MQADVGQPAWPIQVNIILHKGAVVLTSAVPAVRSVSIVFCILDCTKDMFYYDSPAPHKKTEGSGNQPTVNIYI